MKIALDAMGGDHAPEPIVAGAVKAVAADPELRVVLVGDQARIEPLVPADAPGRDRIEFFHCSQAIGMEESPVVGLRKKPDNSISRSWQLLAQQKVTGIVSAGNTGAMVAGGLFLRRFLKNVGRPGIAAVMPTIKGPSVMIDVGANVSPKAEHLFQYGVMGAIFAKHILKCERPTIGLMNVGSEEAKGTDLAKETHALFHASPFAERFVGNVMLKTCEGVFEFVMKVLHKELLPALDVERDKAAQVLQALIGRYDYSAFGGAPLLGIDGICIICHGSSGEVAIKNALAIAAQYVRAGLNDLIVKELDAVHAPGAPGA